MEIIFWNKRTEEFINSLDDEAFGRVQRSIGMLGRKGYLLDMPDSKSLGRGLFELRTHGKKQIRILYVFKNGKIYLLHGFIKKAWKISRKYMEYGRQIQKEVKRLA